MLTATGLSLGLIAACGDDGTTPGGSVDATFALDVIDGIVALLHESAAKQTLDVLAVSITDVASQPAPPPPSLGAVARIPAEALGATFAWDPEQLAYVLDESRTGAPADGARFLLYTVSSTTFLPVVPLEETGYLDIRDFTSGDNIDIRHSAVIGNEGLDFDVSGTLTETSYNLTTDGSVSDGTTGDFTYTAQGTVGGGTSVSLVATAGSYSLSWDYDRMGAYASGPGSDRVTLQNTQSGDKVEFIIDWDESYVVESGSVIEFNDAAVADVSGSGGFIVVTPRDGSGLDENDGLLLASGYFDALTLGTTDFFALTLFAVENAGHTLPVL